MRVVITRAPMLQGARVNGAIRSPQFALESIFRAIFAAVTLLAIVVTSGCVGVTGKGTSPATTGVSIDIAPSLISFGNVTIGQSTTKSVTLSNNGTEMLTVSGISVAGTGFTASGPHLPMSLSAGQSVSISAVYKPTAASANTGTITITSNASGSPSLIGLSGTGTTAAVATLTATPASIAFGSVAVGSQATQTIHLENTGNASAAISKMTISGTGISTSGLTAPATLAPGQTANVTVTYKPVSAGTLTGTVSITSNASNPSVAIGLSATATSAAVAELTVAPTSVGFGSVVVGKTATQTVKVTNTGNASAAISKLSFSGAGVSVSGLTAPMTLAAGQATSFTVTYKPVAAGTLTGTVSITSNASDPSVAIGLSATATSAAVADLTVSPTSIGFGSVVVGKTATQTVKVTNTGNASAAISKLSFSGTGVSVSGLTAPTTLAAGQSANLTVTYKPVSAGTLSGTVSITSNASDPSLVIGLSATATSAAVADLTVSPTTIGFGSVMVGSTATQTVKVTNTGNASAAISKLSFSGAGVSVSGLTAPMTLAAGQATSFTVTYKPVAAGTLTGTVSITSNASDPSVAIGLSAIATSSTMGATPSTATFGNVVVGSTTTQSIRLTNIGTAQIAISSITSSAASVVISGISTPASLAPGTSATFTATYKPTAAATLSGQITVASNAVGSPTMITLSGTAAAATVQLTPSATSLSFGSVNVGSSGTSQLTVKSTGNANASISKAAVTGTGFVLGSSGGSVILDPNQSQAYTVNFNPKAAGSLTGTLTITSNAANSPLNIALSGTGVAPAAEHTVALTWEPSTSSVTGYFVYRGSKPSGPFTQLNSSPESSPSYSDSSVTSGQVYYYFVTAVNSSNIQSADSNEVSVTIPAN